MKNIITIFLKELKRVFSDRRMLLSLFLPGVVIFVFYSLIGNFMTDNVLASKTKDTVFEIVYTDNYNNDLTNKPRLLTYLDASMKDGNSTHYQSISKEKVEEYKTKLVNKDFHLLIAFSDNFEENILDYEEKNNNSLCFFYNGETTASSEIYTTAVAAAKVAYVNYFENIIHGTPVVPNLGKKDSTFSQIMAFIFPMLTVSVLFSTVLSLCPEAIAGEKERGTLASLLLTPIRRSEFVVGKILSLSLLSIASGAVSFLGILFSLPKLMGNVSLGLAPLEIFLLFLLIISALLLFVAIGITVSAFSNTIKEATSYLSPFMVIFMVLGILPASLGSQLWQAFIPVLNLSSCMHTLLMGGSNLPLMLGITIGVNMLVTGALIFVITKLFEKENVILGQ